MKRYNFQKQLHNKPSSGSLRVEGANLAFDTNKVRFILIAVIAIMAMSYLWLVNDTATLGFYLSDLDKNVVVLESKYRKLEIKQTALQSLDHVEDQGQKMGLVATGKVDYADGASVVAFVEGE